MRNGFHPQHHLRRFDISTVDVEIIRAVNLCCVQLRAHEQLNQSIGQGKPRAIHLFKQISQ